MCRTLYITSKNSVTTQTIENDDNLYLYCTNLAKYIIDNYQKSIIENLINLNYFYLLKNEQIFISEKCQKKLVENDDNISVYIVNQLIEYLQCNQNVDLDGFVTFRLKQYKDYIEIKIDEAVSEYLCELKANELLEYLKLYVDSQTPYIQTINIIIQENQYTILSETFEELFIIKYYDDILLNTLITIAPNKIYVYGKSKNQKLFNTINKVFENKTTFYDYVDKDKNYQKQ